MLQKKLEKLYSDKEFKEWKEKNKEYFLAHVFIIAGENWQFGFYNPTTKKIITFTMGDTITHSKEDDILESKQEIKELNPEKVKISYEEAKKKSEELIKKEYKNTPTTKNFAIIQNGEKQIYNITFLAQNFNTINIKIDTETGEIQEHSEQKIASF
jgi:hypothetical protein